MVAFALKPPPVPVPCVPPTHPLCILISYQLRESVLPDVPKINSLQNSVLLFENQKISTLLFPTDSLFRPMKSPRGIDGSCFQLVSPGVVMAEPQPVGTSCGDSHTSQDTGVTQQAANNALLACGRDRNGSPILRWVCFVAFVP